MAGGGVGLSLTGLVSHQRPCKKDITMMDKFLRIIIISSPRKFHNFPRVCLHTRRKCNRCRYQIERGFSHGGGNDLTLLKEVAGSTN